MMKLQPTGKFDNAARAYDRIEVRPLAAAMGAEIAGVDLVGIAGRGLDDAVFAEIRDALFRHIMIYFRDQPISHADQETLTLRFGAFGTDAYTKGLPDHPNVQPVLREAETRVKMIFGEGWHSDSPFLARPPAISILHGVDIPPWGGDTIWANSRLALTYLSPAMRALLAPLRVHMSAIDVITTMEALARERSGGQAKGAKLGDVEMEVDRQAMIDGSFHPLVRTHPVTGLEALYVDETYCQGIEGLREEESRPLLDFLRAHITQASFTCRLRWQPHTVVLWDNRSCLHQAFNDHDGFRREMYRTTVQGEAPA